MKISASDSSKRSDAIDMKFEHKTSSLQGDFVGG